MATGELDGDMLVRGSRRRSDSRGQASVEYVLLLALVVVVLFAAIFFFRHYIFELATAAWLKLLEFT